MAPEAAGAGHLNDQEQLPHNSSRFWLLLLLFNAHPSNNPDLRHFRVCKSNLNVNEILGEERASNRQRLITFQNKLQTLQTSLPQEPPDKHDPTRA